MLVDPHSRQLYYIFFNAFLEIGGHKRLPYLVLSMAMEDIGWDMALMMATGCANGEHPLYAFENLPSHAPYMT